MCSANKLLSLKVPFAVWFCSSISYSHFQGVIFGIDYFQELQRLCSVSDDRSIRLWQASGPVGSLEQTEFRLLRVLYGHSARVWSACLLHNKLVSVGEVSSGSVPSKEFNYELPKLVLILSFLSQIFLLTFWIYMQLEYIILNIYTYFNKAEYVYFNAECIEVEMMFVGFHLLCVGLWWESYQEVQRSPGLY